MENEIQTRTRGRLPHWEQADAIYFVTFRLADSLPQLVLDEIRAEIDHLSAKKPEHGAISREDAEELARLTEERIQRYLDHGAGSCYMRDARIAGLVKDAILHFDGIRYRVHAWCVMPNHVHLVFTLIEPHNLEEVLHSIKSFTAHKANKLLGRTGHFWQREYYDRIVRDAREYEIKMAYVIENPQRAGLEQWPWVGFGVGFSEG